MPSSEPITATVAELMSRGAQTVEPDATLEAVIRRLRLIGHEGFPVIENGRVVGLLTRRDADRALVHGLNQLKVRDVMSAGTVIVRAADPVALLIRRMVESGWGQIPVVDDQGALLGIVTRTDILKYWAQTQPAEADIPQTVSRDQLAAVLGAPAARLIERVAQEAGEAATSLYMVGGVVRDLLLKRRNDDIDFVIEGDAIAFAERLCARYGGEVNSYCPFGTATWQLEETGFMQAELPQSIDFASARSEFYEQPTVLPTVYNSSIKLDLGRRDFTINTLAVLLSPSFGQLVDFYGGLADLRAGVIRVLHSLSFVDDPTRILRAVRFEKRLGFVIEPRTAELIETALPMLRRITGERLRNELTLMLQIDDAADAFLSMQARGILKAIHPAFVVPENLAARFETDALPPWAMQPPDATDLRWCVLLADVPLEELASLTERLLFSKGLAEAVLDTARLTQTRLSPTLPPSQITAKLEGISDLALYAAWKIYETTMDRSLIQSYAETWRGVRPKTDGRALQALGIRPGPCYGAIITRLRAARLDGEARSDEDEARLLERLLKEGICDDDAR